LAGTPKYQGALEWCLWLYGVLLVGPCVIMIYPSVDPIDAIFN
jgi:hypothetical protein